MFNIVIPTYNPKYLKDTILSIPENYRNEVLVVENGSKISEDIQSLGVNYVYLEEAGANMARNHGWKQSEEDFVLFTDDDITFGDGYFVRLEEYLTKYTPNIIGGNVTLVGADKWVVGTFAKTLAELKWEEWSQSGSEIMFLNRKQNHYLVGANMCVKRSFLEAHGGFDENFGYHKDRIPNDEQYLLDRAECFLYSPLLKVYHNIKNRCNIDYMMERFKGQAIADCRYYAQFEPSRINFIKNFVMPMANSIINNDEVHKARAEIKDETITEKFIIYFLSCKNAYLNSFLAEIANVY